MTDLRDPFKRPKTKLTETQREHRILALIRNDHYAIENALQVFARSMEGAAQTARAAYEAGQADSVVKADQDSTILPNKGLRTTADMFSQEAEKARRIAGELEWLLDEFAHDEHDEEDD